MAAPKEKDFGKIEKQVSSYQPSPEPDELRPLEDELRPLDEAHGGIPVPHKIVEDNPQRHFKKELEHTKEYNFVKGKNKWTHSKHQT